MAVRPIRYDGNVGKLMSSDQPIGSKLSMLRAWREQIERAERQLTIQLGVDVAKDLIARGVPPTGGTVTAAYQRLDDGGLR